MTAFSKNNHMVLRYRVSLSGIKGFTRVYQLRPNTSLYDFHIILRRDLEFAQDQLIQFKALAKDGSLVARDSMFDLGYGTVDEVSLADTVAKGITSFRYFYDVPNKKSVIVDYEGECDETPGMSYPALTESKGPVPAEFENGYVAYEDLPESKKVPPQGKNLLAALLGGDDSEDEDLDDIGDSEEEEDDEDGKEIYDEDEGGF